MEVLAIEAKRNLAFTVTLKLIALPEEISPFEAVTIHGFLSVSAIECQIQSNSSGIEGSQPCKKDGGR
jgi:hypothetical protein